MPDAQARIDELFKGLRLLADTAFPKQCPGCGKVYENLPTLLDETRAVDSKTGLAQPALGAELLLSRQCGCGMVMTDQVDDRRANDPLGVKRREIFDRLLTLLTDGGMEHSIAKAELLKVMRGGQSDLLAAEQLTKFFS